MTKVINNLVSEIKKNKQIPQMLGVEAVEELIKDIKNLLCLDPEKDGDLIDKLQSLPETYLKNNCGFPVSFDLRWRKQVRKV